MSKTVEVLIGKMPVTIYGENSEKVLIYVHGQGGQANEVERFADVIENKGFQILAVNLPKHGERNDDTEFVPWLVVPELKLVSEYVKIHWQRFVICATSIGVWFSLFAFNDIGADKFLFFSPLVDMENMIDNLMTAACVTEARLKKEKVVETEFGQTLSIEYLNWVRNNPVTFVSGRTSILYAENDTVIPFFTVKAFADKYKCKLSVMNGGEHWFHTKSQILHLKTSLYDELN